jgi:hypothetical protein
MVKKKRVEHKLANKHSSPDQKLGQTEAVAQEAQKAGESSST